MRSRIAVLMIATVISILNTAILAPAVSASVEGDEVVSLDAKDTDIRELLSGLAKTYGINLIISDSVSGKATVNLREVSPIEAIQLILISNGFAMEKIGSTVIASRSQEVRGFLPRSSKVIALQYASAIDLIQSLSGIATGYAEIQADSRTNSVIITGTEAGIQELEQAIKSLDVPAKPAVSKVTRIFPLKYSQASSLQKAMSELCSPEGKVSIDDSTNSLIITDEPSTVGRLEEVIAQLDMETPYIIQEKSKKEEPKPQLPPEPHTRVFSLNHMDANSMKDVLQEMLSPIGKIQTFVRQKGAISPMQTGVGTFDTDRGGVSSTMRQLEEQKWSDLLIVTDEASVVEDIGELIRKLDTKASQVKIEAKVVEINLSSARDLGINWQAVHSPSGSTVEADFPIFKTEGIDLQLGTVSAQRFEDIIFRLQALETLGEAKIMFNPSIMTLDNEMAQMLVADKIPIARTYETELRATTGFEFINVGISLTVIPHITEDGYIVMDTMPQVDSIKEWTRGENPQPIISSRVAHTRVRVRDGDTFALSGLIKDEQNEGESRIPLLGRIPFLGRLFGSKNASNTKTDLMVFITPTIYRDDLR